MAGHEFEKFHDLMEDFSNAMLVTRTPDGELRSRPMAVAEHRPDGDLFFVTSIDSAKVDEIARYPEVNVSFQDKSRYLSLSGRAEIVQDRDLIHELWSEEWRLWFPEGKDDPELTLLRVHADRGEYWDFKAKHRLEFLVKAGKALLQRKSVEREDPGDHGKVGLH